MTVETKLQRELLDNSYVNATDARGGDRNWPDHQGRGSGGPVKPRATIEAPGNVILVSQQQKKMQRCEVSQHEEPSHACKSDKSGIRTHAGCPTRFKPVSTGKLSLESRALDHSAILPRRELSSDVHHPVQHALPSQARWPSNRRANSGDVARRPRTRRTKCHSL